MSTDRDTTRIVRSWLEEGVTALPDRVLDTVLDQVPATPQRRSWVPAWRVPMTAQMRSLLAAAAVLIIAVAGYNLLAPDEAVGPSPGPSQTNPRPASSDSPSTLPELSMPGSRADGPAGDYGWTGSLGSRTGMHSVVIVGSEVRMTQLSFTVENDCFTRDAGAQPGPVTVAGLEGMYAEPYVDPGVLFMPRPEPGQTTGAYALPIGGRTLCVYLTWDAMTTPAELDAARQVVESIRGQPFGETGIRIVFRVPARWDTG
jgi:hypothetical protein